MNTKTLLAASTMLGALALSAVQASAAPMAMPSGAEKCYGVSAAGKNDCAAGGSFLCRPVHQEFRQIILRIPSRRCLLQAGRWHHDGRKVIPMGPLSSPSAALANPIPARAGVGLRFPHHDHVLSAPHAAAWLEVHPENYLGEGVAADILCDVRTDYPVSLHATGLSLGSADGVDRDHLAVVAALCRRIVPGLVSDHLSWSAAGALHLPDLMPLPYMREAQDVFARNIETVQQALGRSILIENPSVYLAIAGAEMSEGEFLAGLVRRTGCGVLLDINNIAVSAANLGEDAAGRLAMMLDAIAPDAIGEIHLAGHAVRTLPDGVELRIDDHGSPVSEDVWRLFDTAIRRIGARPTLIEWDTAVPGFDILAGEAAMADVLMAHAREMRHAAVG